MANKTVADNMNAYAKQLSYGSELPTVRSEADLRAFGDVVMGSQEYISEFAGTFFKIASMVIESHFWKNPFEVFFKKLDYGIGVEEVFINLTKPLKYDPYGAGETEFRRIMPDVRNCLHVLNVEFQVIQTIYETNIRRAFYSYASMNEWWSGVITAINNTVAQTIYSLVKYELCLSILDSGTATLFLDENDQKKTVKSMKALAGKLKFLSPLYNRAAVTTFSNREDLYLFCTPEFNADLEVEVLAYMFNVEYGKVDFHVFEIDSFDNHDYNVLANALKGGVPHIFTSEELEALSKNQAFLCDENYLFLYNFDYRQSSKYMHTKVAWNYFTTYFGSISTSPFKNGIAMTYGNPGTATGIRNPYTAEKITVGRMNMFNALDTKLTGQFINNKVITPTVTGSGLIPVEGNPGWYQASNQKGSTATITYTSTSPSLTLSVDVEVV